MRVRLLFLCTALTIMVSCTKSENGRDVESREDAPRFTAMIRQDGFDTKSETVKTLSSSCSQTSDSGSMGIVFNIEETTWEVEAETKTAILASMPTSFNVSAVYSDGTRNDFVVSSHGGTEYYADISSSSPRWNRPGETVRFYGYSNTISSTPAAPTFDLTLTAVLPDIIEARSAEYPGDYNDSVPLEFEHALSAIEFKTGDNLFDMTINSISINGLYSSFTKTVGYGTWSKKNDNTTSLSSGNINLPISGASGETIYGGDNTLMIIPQTASENAFIQIATTIDSKSYTFKVDIAGMEFVKGKKYAVSLSLPANEWLYELDAGIVYCVETYHDYAATIQIENNSVISAPAHYESHPRYLVIHSRKVSRSGIVRRVAWSSSLDTSSNYAPTYSLSPSSPSGTGVTGNWTTSFGWVSHVATAEFQNNIEPYSYSVVSTTSYTRRIITQAESGRTLAFTLPYWD